jgi:hypothetical protein
MARKDNRSDKSGLHNDIREMLQVMNDSMNKHIQYMDNLFGNDKILMRENLCVLDKPQTWNDMKILMREKFYQHDLAEHIPIISSSMPNIL